MNDTATDLDQADEDILTYTVSDETLEAAASTERVTLTITSTSTSRPVSECPGTGC